MRFMGKVKPVVRERGCAEKLDEDKAARTGVGKRILLLLGHCFLDLYGLADSGHDSVTALQSRGDESTLLSQPLKIATEQGKCLSWEQGWSSAAGDAPAISVVPAKSPVALDSHSWHLCPGQETFDLVTALWGN